MDKTDLLAQAQHDIQNCASLVALEQIKVHFLGKKGLITES
jgi:hypothetical protein